MRGIGVAGLTGALFGGPSGPPDLILPAHAATLRAEGATESCQGHQSSLGQSSTKVITHGPSSGGISGLMAPPLLQGHAGPIAAISRSPKEASLFLLNWPDLTVLEARLSWIGA